MDVNVFDVFQFTTVVILIDIQSIPSRPGGAFGCWALSPLTGPSESGVVLLLSGVTVLQASRVISCPQPGISHFSKGPCFPSVRNGVCRPNSG